MISKLRFLIRQAKVLIFNHNKLILILVIAFTVTGTLVYTLADRNDLVVQEKITDSPQTNINNGANNNPVFNNNQVTNQSINGEGSKTTTSSQPSTANSTSQPSNNSSSSSTPNSGSSNPSSSPTPNSPTPSLPSNPGSSDSTNSDPSDNPDPTPTNPEPSPETPSAIVAFYGDSQTDTAQEQIYHQSTVANILATVADPIFHLGDLMEDGTQQSLDYFNSATETLRSTRTFYSALGNNDRKVGNSSIPSPLYLDNFVFPDNEQWYSVNIGNLHIVVLDSAFSSTSEVQKNWLESDLQSNDAQSRIIGVIFHHPTYSSNISSILENNGADFVISGHTHVYAHSNSNGINYFVTSGQPSIGYLLVSAYSNKVVFKYYNSDNILVEIIEDIEV